MERHGWLAKGRTGILIGMLVTLGLPGAEARGQIPGLPGAPAAPAGAAAKKDADEPAPAPTADNPEATVATSTGTITVGEKVGDDQLQETLFELLPRYPGVRTVDVEVDNGVVTLDGQVENDETRTKVTEFVRRVEGVKFVLNAMKTDAQVMTARQRALDTLDRFWTEVRRDWLVVLLAAGVVLASILLGRLFNRYSEILLAPFVKNLLLRSVVGSLLGSLIVVGGLLLALRALNLTQVVLSVLGLAGVVGLAVGFAFRDITENFIASVLLGVRRPFMIGDYVAVAGQAGIVRSLNTRATVLATLEGNLVRIPNAVIYKEILVNSTASPSTRGTFEVLIPYEVSTAAALEAITRALREQEGILADPPARALVEALEPAGVRLRAYFWVPAKGVDGYQLNSDARLRVKVALQQAGIAPPPTGVTVTMVGRVPVELSRAGAHGPAHPAARAAPRPGAVVTAEQAAANLRHDARAAEAAPSGAAAGETTPVEHVLNEAQTCDVMDEGTNLLADKAEDQKPATVPG